MIVDENQVQLCETACFRWLEHALVGGGGRQHALVYYACEQAADDGLGGLQLSTVFKNLLKLRRKEPEPVLS